MKKKIIIPMLLAGTIALTGCSALDSTVKSWESNTKGLPRTIEVYSITGELLAEHDGKSVRIESENESGKVSVLIDGKRHSYYGATVLIKEK
jgi:ABC-type glycerol-3-phosphate transport system substrate-binding protein